MSQAEVLEGPVRTSEIKLHSAEAFEGMRRAGKLAAECLDLLVPLVKPGMFFTIEPMVNLGKYEVKLLNDGWTAVTRDKSLSAQFEHAVGVTETGVEIFTLSPAGLDRPPIQGVG